jgi:restriction endonuclease S subunit
VRAGWEPKKLGTAVTLVMGQAPAGTDCNRDKVGTPFVKVGEFSDERPIFREWTTNPKKMARYTDVLICVVGATCGKINLGQDCAIGRSVAAIRPKLDKIEQRYLWYFMQGKVLEMRQGSQGAAQTVINRDMINELQIPLPPLDEQRRIVAVLDKAFAAIATATANAQQNLSNARALFESYQSRLFREAGESLIPLGDMASFRNGLNFTGSSKGETIRIVGVKDFQNRLWIPDDNLAIVQIDGKLAETDVLQEGDILTVRSNGNRELIGRCMVAPAMSAKTSHSGFTIRIRPDADKVDPNYLCRILKSPQTRKLLVDGGNGANISSLNQQLLGSLLVPVPSKTKQSEIVCAIDAMAAKVGELSETISEKLTALAELKQSLLQKAFAGELTAAAPHLIAANDNFATPQFTAQILAFAHRRHELKQKQRTFGHVKAQKSLHLVESVSGIDLGRQPIKDAAGPNDMQHMLRATDWAVQQGFFEFVQRANGNGYEFRKLANYDACWADAEAAINPVAADVSRAIDLIVDSDSDFAELITTTHAAWNNLIIDKAAITDDAIVLAARDNWHVSKLKHDPSRFHDAIRFIRTNSIVPDGSAKYVGGQVSLF